jgi:hypothetical protein
MAVNTVESGPMCGPSESDALNHGVSEHVMGIGATQEMHVDQLGKPTPTIHTQRTLLNTNNTAKNWRSLITPAHDSFKKLEK